MDKKIAILGWGSLLWEDSPLFDDQHGPWKEDGPALLIEFSRISSSRHGALTLVIDPDKGVPVRVSYCLSKRTDPQDAVCDLRCREGTTVANIGYLCPNGKQVRSRHSESLETIKQWAKESNLDFVVWTDLRGNFEKESGTPFSFEAVVSYLKSLCPLGKAKAFEYISRAPKFVKTPLRTTLQIEPWFNQKGKRGRKRGQSVMSLRLTHKE
jgi:hypothetical protein